MTDDDHLSDVERIKAIVSCPELVALAETLPVHHHSDGGRPRLHSVYSLLLVHVLGNSVYGGRVRRMFSQCTQPYWSWLGDLVRKFHSDRPDLWLSATPMRRHHYYAFRDRYLSTTVGTSAATTVLLEAAIELAQELRLFVSAGSMTYPDLTSCIEGDGKVVRSITRFRPGDTRLDPDTGEVRARRHDPDVGQYKVGGGTKIEHGHKVVLTSARGPEWHRRVIFGVGTAPDGSELDVFIPLVRRLNSQLEIAVAVYDGAARGKHIAELLRTEGIVCIAPSPPLKSDRRGGQREERQVLLEPVIAWHPDGSEEPIEVWAVGGAACETAVNENGERVFHQLALTKLERRGSRGSYRLYGNYAARSGARLRLALYQTDGDTRRRFNRCDHLRAFPKHTAQYQDLYGRRADTESLNRQIQDACWQGRANCYGRHRVFASVVAFAIGHNAISRYIHRRATSTSPPPTQAA